MANRKKLQLALCFEWLFEKPHFFAEKIKNTFRNFTHCIKSRIVGIFRELAQLFLSLCWKHLLVVFGVGRTDITTRLNWLQRIGFKRFHNSFDTNLLSKCHPSLERNRSSGYAVFFHFATGEVNKTKTMSFKFFFNGNVLLLRCNF